MDPVVMKPMSKEADAFFFKEGIIPIWEGDTVYDESVCFTADEKGFVEPAGLLYRADSVIRVRSSDFKTEFEEGKDYLLEDGKLVRTPGSRMPLTDYAAMFPAEKSASSKEGAEGGFVLYDELMEHRQVLVTYRHSDRWEGPAVPDQSDRFSRTLSILENGGTLKVLFYGDSITTGCCSSSFWNEEPMLPDFPNAVCEILRRRYPKAEVILYNTAVGGTNSTWAAEHSAERLIPYKADLVVIAFGMNDGKKGTDRYMAYNRQLILDARAANPDCEILMICTTVPNKLFKGFWGYQVQFGAASRNLAANYDLGAADMTSIHEYILSKKRFADQTGNNINHPNDFLSRVHTQLIIRTITGKDGV